MKELEVEIRLRNNRLKERRAALGLSQIEMAAAIGIGIGAYGPLENLSSTAKRTDGQWTRAAIKTAEFFEVDLEELFPPAVIGIKRASAVRKADVADLAKLLPPPESAEKLALLPSEVYDSAELRGRVDAVLETLTDREARILRKRFGLDDGGDGITLEEIGEEEHKNRERIRQIEAKALRKLRHPTRRNVLRTFVDPDFIARAQKCGVCGTVLEGELGALPEHFVGRDPCPGGKRTP